MHIYKATFDRFSSFGGIIDCVVSFQYTVMPRYNAVVGRHLLGPPYKRGALWDPVDLFDKA